MLDVEEKDSTGVPYDCLSINKDAKFSVLPVYNDSSGSEIALCVTNDNVALVKFIITEKQMLCFLEDSIKEIFKFTMERGNE